jgi:GTP-binding protein LepA
MQKRIRNFVIIAHIDHGKSTLADRLLEATGTVDKRIMKPQYLDQLELERERGITIKMAPVRMVYRPGQIRNLNIETQNKSQIQKTENKENDFGFRASDFVLSDSEYILNLIDTPGHSDFGYEVSRALTAVEGAVLLVDATQGIQAQTLANYVSAKRANLTIIGVLNKIDVASPEQIEEAKRAITELIGQQERDILLVSGKTGYGVSELLERIVRVVPSPKKIKDEDEGNPVLPKKKKTISRALVFDSHFDEHKGIIAFIRVFDGVFEINANAELFATKTRFKIKEVGQFSPKLIPGKHMQSGEIGYIATGIKNPDALKIGDTIFSNFENRAECKPFAGYKEPNPVVFVSFYPEDASEYDALRLSLAQLRLNDAALQFEPDMSEILGRGFKGGFLGRLHFEITAERLAKEYGVDTVHSFPSVAHQVKLRNNGWLVITNPKDFPDAPTEVLEPITKIEILTPSAYIGAVLQLQEQFRISDTEVKTLVNATHITAKLPLADLISDFDDRLKSVSEGFASLSYKSIGWQQVNAVKMEILVAQNPVPGLTRILPREGIEYVARATVQKLKDLLPRQQFSQAIQAAVNNRVIARETLPALRKDVTGYLYGGDRTRKMKLWKKQQKGKKRLKERGAENKISIPASVFKELLKK